MIGSLLSVSLIGCIQFQDRPLNADESAFRIESRTLSSEGLREFLESATGQKTEWPSKSWDVDPLTLAALYYHFDLALAGAQADSPDAATITAVLRPNPSTTVLPTWVNNGAAEINPWIIASALKIPIEFPGNHQFSMDKAEHLAEAACLRISDTAWLARGRVRLTMLEAYATQGSERLPQQQLNMSAARKRVAESREMVSVTTGVPLNVLLEIELDLTNLSKPSVLPAIPVQNLQEIVLRERPIAEAEAARPLGIHRSQLYVKLKELGIVPEEESPLPEEREHT